MGSKLVCNCVKGPVWVSGRLYGPPSLLVDAQSLSSKDHFHFILSELFPQRQLSQIKPLILDWNFFLCFGCEKSWKSGQYLYTQKRMVFDLAPLLCQMLHHLGQGGWRLAPALLRLRYMHWRTVQSQLRALEKLTGSLVPRHHDIVSVWHGEQGWGANKLSLRPARARAVARSWDWTRWEFRIGTESTEKCVQVRQVGQSDVTLRPRECSK